MPSRLQKTSISLQQAHMHCQCYLVVLRWKPLPFANSAATIAIPAKAVEAMKEYRNPS